MDIDTSEVIDIIDAEGEGDDALEGLDAVTGPVGDLTMKEAQDAIRQLLIYVRDGRLKSGVPDLRAVPATAVPSAVADGGRLTHVVSVDTTQSAAAKRAPKREGLEELMDDLSDQTDDLVGDNDAGDDEEREPIDLRFRRADHDHNISAWRQGDDINVAMRVLKADGQPRVLTAHASHGAEMAKIVECFKALGYTPDKIMRLPLDELASRLGASGLIAPTAKHAGAILGLDGRAARAPFVCGLVK